MTDRDPRRTLYPFLDDERREPLHRQKQLAESVAAKAEDSIAVKRAFFDEHAEALIRMAERLADSYAAGGRLFTMGNGGSSCDAAHVAVEFLHPVTAGRPALTALHLGADLPMLTAVANDVGFDQVFARQLIAQGRSGDCVLGISTSGNSANLLAAFRQAKALGLVTLGLSGGDGGAMAESPDVDQCLTVRSDSVHRIQETHVTAYHVLWDLVHTLLSDRRGDGRGGIT